MWQSLEIFNDFNTLTLKQIFWKTKTFFKKLEHRFLVESTKIENALFPYKTAISEAHVKTNRMVITKWIYHRERSFASNYFIFLKALFQFKNLFTKSWFDVPLTQVPTFLVFVNAGVFILKNFAKAFSLFFSELQHTDIIITISSYCHSISSLVKAPKLLDIYYYCYCFY